MKKVKIVLIILILLLALVVSLQNTESVEIIWICRGTYSGKLHSQKPGQVETESQCKSETELGSRPNEKNQEA
jgi:hypothetical protein